MTAGPPRAAILAFHRVASPRSDCHRLAVAADLFDEELHYLQASCSVVKLSALTRPEDRQRLPPRAVALTFDDGYEDALFTVVPMLDARRLPGTFFLTTAGLDQAASGFRYWWDVLEHVFLVSAVTPAQLRLSHLSGDHLFATDSAERRQAAHDHITELMRILPMPERNAVIAEILRWSDVSPSDISARPLTTSQILKLASLGNHDVGAHTVNHLWLPLQSTDVQKNEMERCRTHLERVAKRQVSALAYPFGAADDGTAKIAAAAGFAAGVTMGDDAVNAETTPLLLPRINAGQYKSAAELAARLDDLFELRSL